MAAHQLAHWLVSAKKKELKNDIKRNNRLEEKAVFAKIKYGILDPDDATFTPYRHNKNEPYYD